MYLGVHLKLMPPYDIMIAILKYLSVCGEVQDIRVSNNHRPRGCWKIQNTIQCKALLYNRLRKFGKEEKYLTEQEGNFLNKCNKTV
jgi:hypothetical protein